MRRDVLYSVLGAVGLLSTVVSSVVVTPKAIQKIKEDSLVKYGDPNAYTKRDAVKSAWKYYIPSAIIGGLTVGCIFSGLRIADSRYESLLVKFLLLEKSYKRYVNKNIELFGSNHHRVIEKSICLDECKEQYITADGICFRSSLDFDDIEEKRLFYDSFSKRYFESTIGKVLQAEYHLNRNFALSGEQTLNDFYDFLGLENVPNGDEIGWGNLDGWVWIDFSHEKTTLEDGLEVLVIDMVMKPEVLEE